MSDLGRRATPMRVPPELCQRDSIYTLFLAVTAFIVLCTVIWWPLFIRSQRIPGSPFVIVTVEVFESCLLAACIAVLIIRAFFPAKRRWPTIWLDILLLPLIPYGTALGVFGLIFVDRGTKETEGIAKDTQIAPHPTAGAVSIDPARPSQKPHHDKIYTWLLAIATFLSLCVVIWFDIYIWPHIPSNAARVFSIVEIEDVFLIVVCAAVLVLRMAFPSKRKWPTICLNILLLVVIPFGTMLGLYGLFFVDKKSK